MIYKDFLVILSTCPGGQAAEGLARMLVEEGLAACVNILPRVRSIYRWQGAVQADEEALMVIKAKASSFEALRAALVSQHPYEVPEVIALPIADGHHPYLDWLAAPDGTPATPVR